MGSPDVVMTIHKSIRKRVFLCDLRDRLHHEDSINIKNQRPLTIDAANFHLSEQDTGYRRASNFGRYQVNMDMNDVNCKMLNYVVSNILSRWKKCDGTFQQQSRSQFTERGIHIYSRSLQYTYIIAKLAKVPVSKHHPQMGHDTANIVKTTCIPVCEQSRQIVPSLSMDNKTCNSYELRQRRHINPIDFIKPWIQPSRHPQKDVGHVNSPASVRINDIMCQKNCSVLIVMIQVHAESFQLILPLQDKLTSNKKSDPFVEYDRQDSVAFDDYNGTVGFSNLIRCRWKPISHHNRKFHSSANSRLITPFALHRQ